MAGVRPPNSVDRVRSDAAPGDSALDVLIRQYLPLVYSAARRHLQDPTLAEDITQAVFMVLARRHARLPANVVLSSWLLKVTYLTCLQARRNLRRRLEHERRAAQMRPVTTLAETATQMADEVNVALACLGDPDRSVLTLRYLEQKSVVQVAENLGITEHAAQMRIGRAMTKLREKLGVTEEQFGAASLGAFFLSQSHMAVPAHLTAHVSHTVAAMGSAGVSKTAAGILSKGVLKTLFWSSLKIPLTLTAVTAIVAVSTFSYIAVERTSSENGPSVVRGPGGGLPVQESMPASTNFPGAEYPRIDALRRATFRFHAPSAQAVTVDLGDRYDMTKDSAGDWMVTTSPLSPGFHYYQFYVDGASQPDPGSREFFGVSKIMSGLEVPAPETAFCTVQNVPHGDIRAIAFDSATTGNRRQLFVYTPPSYDARPDQHYPVLYLLPGAGEDQRAWIEQGNLGTILDNLIAAGRARDMIVVSEEAGTSTGFSRGERGNRAGRNGARAASRQNFPQILISEAIPAIDKTFRTIPDRAHRALAGSAGGATQSLEITQDYLNTFAYVGAFGAQPGYPNVPEGFGGLFGNPGEFAKQVKVMYIGAAANENNAVARMFHQELEDAGIPHVYTETPGTSGGWQTWRSGLRDFASLIFKD